MLGAVAGISITLVVVSEEEESPDGWQESDSNADGEVDEWIIFKDGKFLKWERDNNFDGRRDDWTEFEDGVPVRSRKDTNFDGKPDEWVQFDEMGRASEIKNDLNFDDKVDEKLNDGYDYADTPYVRMSAASIATITGGPTPSTPSKKPAVAPVTTTAPSAQSHSLPVSLLPSKSAPPGTPVIVTVLKKQDPDHVNPSIPPPFGLIRWLRPVKGGTWEALDSNEDRLLDLPLLTLE